MKSASVFVLMGFAVLTGCSRESRPEAAAAPRTSDLAELPGVAEQIPAPLSKVGARRVIDRPAVQNDMKQLALFYKTCEAEQGRVKSVAVFKSYIKRDAPKLYKAIEDNVYVVVPNVRTDANAVLAYEANPDGAGQHIVAMGDGSVQTLNTQQLQAALKKQGN